MFKHWTNPDRAQGTSLALTLSEIKLIKIQKLYSPIYKPDCCIDVIVIHIFILMTIETITLQPYCYLLYII